MLNERHSPIEKKIRMWCRKVHADLGQLDILVEDALHQRANRINSNGLRAQVTFLLKTRTPKQLRRMVIGELNILREYALKYQHKNPGITVSLNPKKKRKKK